VASVVRQLASARVRVLAAQYPAPPAPPSCDAHVIAYSYYVYCDHADRYSHGHA
jgi:hypothetical protein